MESQNCLSRYREVAKYAILLYYLTMSSLLQYMKFGNYLLQKKLVNVMDILNARFLQKKNNLRIGELAKTKGWLTEDDIFKILIIQEETHEKFGEIAVREKYLKGQQVDVLLKEQEDSYIYFGEALVKTGVISEGQLIEELKEFNKMKLNMNDR